MKKIILFFSLLGCISLCSHARLNFPYDRSFNPRSEGFTRHTVVPADSSLTTNFYGVEMSAMDYAEINITVAPYPYHIQRATAYIVGYGPSPRLKGLDKTSTERQKLIIADDDFYELYKCVGSFDDAYGYHDASIAIMPPREDKRRVVFIDAMADYVTFDFDLSEYACDFDVYFLLLGTRIIFDNAFSNFIFSDNVKSVNVFIGRSVQEIGHQSFTYIENIENVDVRLTTIWRFVNGGYYRISSENSDLIRMYSDSFSQETYDNAHVPTFASESKINDLITNPSTWNYSNNIYRFFKNWHSGVEDISIDESPVQYTIQGRIIKFTNLAPNESVNVYTLTGSSVGNYTADQNGSTDIEIAQSGFYLIKANNACYKVSIH